GGGKGEHGDIVGGASSTSSRLRGADVSSKHASSSSAATTTMPSAPQGAPLPRAPRPRESLATGAPPRGLVAWCVSPEALASPAVASSGGGDAGEPIARASSPSAGGGGGEEVCVLSVGPGGSGRFERFRVEPDGAGR